MHTETDASTAGDEPGGWSARVSSDALLGALFDLAPVGLGMVDASFRFVRVNRALARMNGLLPERHVGRTPRELLPQVPMEQVEATWRRILETGEAAIGFELSGETPASPGLQRTYVEDWLPLRVGGTIAGIGIVVRDVTEERRGADLRNALLGIVGHDLRNPLSVIGMTATAMTHDAEPKRTLMGQRIQRAVSRIEGLARDLLDYTLASRGETIPVHPRPVRVAELLREAVEETAARYPGREVRLHGDGEQTVLWDPERILQLAGNLLTNAVEHGERSQPVQVSWLGGRREVVLTFENHGPPIPPHHLPRLFHAGWRGDRQGEGSGLGLYIVREIARAHGGDIAVHSCGGRNVFTVTLPRAAPPAEPCHAGGAPTT